GDWRALRDFFYHACRCTHFWTSPSSEQEGPPDGQVRQYYAMRNGDFGIDLRAPHKKPPSWTIDVCVWFHPISKNAPNWGNEVRVACIRCLARSTGDAHLAWNGAPILARRDGGLIRINSNWVEGKIWPDYEAECLNADVAQTLEALRREALAFDEGQLHDL